MLGALAALALPTPSAAQGLLRDAGMEYALNSLARPILLAAGLPANRTKMLVVNDMSLNAFVVDSRHVFIHAGLLLRLRSADEMQAVIAHEVAHIANGHFARRMLNMQNARSLAGLGAVLAVAAGAAAGSPGLAGGLIAGSASSAERGFLAHTRAEEAAADQSGMRYMAQAGISPEAMRGVLNQFAGQEALAPAQQDPYARTHPLTSDRLRSVDQITPLLTVQETDRSHARYWFTRVQAKLSAYLRSPGYTFSRLSPTDDSDAAMIQRAVAHFRQPDLAAARRAVAVLIDRHPEDAYLHELSGWIELESGQAAPAVTAYERAAKLAPTEPLVLAGYGRALLARDTPGDAAAALDALESARARDPFSPRLLRDLAVAYARDGQLPMASLSTAERYALSGALDDARIHAHRAAGQLPTGSPGWSRAQDIIRAAEMAAKRGSRR